MKRKYFVLVILSIIFIPSQPFNTVNYGLETNMKT